MQWWSLHSRGYIALFHYGGTTGVVQVDDTDCHGDFEQTYLELEQISFNERQAVDPGNISRLPQEVLEEACSAWRLVDHTRGVLGHKRNGLKTG